MIPYANDTSHDKISTDYSNLSDGNILKIVIIRILSLVNIYKEYRYIY